MLTPVQIQKLHPLLVSNFEGSYADQLLANFSFLRVGIPLNTVTANNNLFQTKVLDFLQKLNGYQLYKALNELKLEYPDNDELENAVDDILKELNAPPLNGVESPLASHKQQPIRKLLVANGMMDRKFAPDIKKHLQEVMEGWQIVGSWETGSTSVDSIQEHAAVIALLTNIAPQRGVLDPPLSIVNAALRNLGRQHWLVLLAYDSRALKWIQEQISLLDLKEFVETEPFFDADDRPLFFSQAGEFRAAEVEWRVKQIGYKLSGRFQQASTEPDGESSGPVASATIRRLTVPIIVLGEPDGPSDPDVKASTNALKAALNKSGLEFDYWKDGWRNGGARPSSLLSRDPIFIRVAADAENNTLRVAQELERALRSVFAPTPAAMKLLSGCRQILWRAAGSPWELVDESSDPSRSSDDLDTIETRVTSPDRFVKWLERFAAPAAVIFHEALAEQRPAGLIRMLRETIVESLSIPTRKALVRVRAFEELPNFGNDPLTIVAVDDLPIAASVDFCEKTRARLSQFSYKIDRIIEQKGEDTSGPAVLRVAILTQESPLYNDNSGGQGNLLQGWKPLRVRRDGAIDFRAHADDAKSLIGSIRHLIKSGEAPGSNL
ncbi:hypothetical protein [Bradyrhizobium sp. BTAi1]|uniref:hypothetical protein n=1 Tax=Bradyrhizobium sp. (strain BTAi1 / ATCC BAA-1182) TaxID=288000 RepID=UPI00005DCAE7|nr:hypothetical protein [Bradyrhizobium sp. BTAi1]ABQ36976.1 hypothetical protein BBta_4963 [Bradyrhizobium sp. BTAi1]